MKRFLILLILTMLTFGQSEFFYKNETGAGFHIGSFKFANKSNFGFLGTLGHVFKQGEFGIGVSKLQEKIQFTGFLAFHKKTDFDFGVSFGFSFNSENVAGVGLGIYHQFLQEKGFGFVPGISIGGLLPVGDQSGLRAQLTYGLDFGLSYRFTTGEKDYALSITPSAVVSQNDFIPVLTIGLISFE